MKVKRTIPVYIIILILGVLGASISSHADGSIVLIDDIGDDHGSGAITYPTDLIFTKGMFDLKSVMIDSDSNDVRFTVEFQTDLPRLPTLKISELYSLSDIVTQDFYGQNVDIYIDTGDPEDTGVTWLMPGRGATLAAGFRWNRAVILTPQPAVARSKLKRLLANGILHHSRTSTQKSMSRKEAVIKADDFIQKHVLFPESVNQNGKTLTFTVTESFFGSDTIITWRYQVIVTGAAFSDSFDLARKLVPQSVEGNLMVREITPVGNQWTFGGASGIPGESNIIDMLVPPGYTQVNILSKYSKELSCRIPMIQIPETP
ncbi:hypothetical protein JW979_15235 [bacterium]|nr:hypothetical protein [candidate division CSSED10-310 bacterium]